jgi:pimeloyl-ACP methyl ester carboxylesterase
MKHPERLNKVYAHAANVTVDGVDPAVANNATFNAYIERMGKDYAKMSKTPDQYAGFLEQISKMWASEPAWTKEQLGKITVPTAIVLGDHDEAITRVHSEYMASVIPGAKLIILSEASHFAMLQDPAGYTKSVVDFFKGM